MNEMPSKAELAADARGLVRRALKASLATIASGSSYPYASLITTATEASSAPIFLISGLAQHTKNLAEDPRASILFDGTGAAPVPLRGTRVHNVWIHTDGLRLAELAALVDAGQLTPRVAATLPLEQVATAHERVAAGGLRGRIVLTLDG